MIISRDPTDDVDLSPGCVNENSRQYLVVFHAHHHFFLYGKSSGLSHSGENFDTNR